MMKNCTNLRQKNLIPKRWKTKLKNTKFFDNDSNFKF